VTDILDGFGEPLLRYVEFVGPVRDLMWLRQAIAVLREAEEDLDGWPRALTHQQPWRRYMARISQRDGTDHVV
jgi:hypothetical protein